MKYANLEWKDGQPYSPDFDDVYFSIDNGIEETEHVFIQHNQLLSRFSQHSEAAFIIAETGFGSGLNFLITAKHWLELSDSTQCLYFYSVENAPFTADDLIRAQAAWPEYQFIAKQLQQQYQPASYGFHSLDLFQGRIKLILMIGEVVSMLSQMQATVDAWFLDGFAPGCNPQMWTKDVFSGIKRLSQISTTFSTYTAAGVVRRGLADAGFEVEKVAATGNKRHMLAGRLNSDINSVAVERPWYEPVLQQSTTGTICIIGAGIAGLTTAHALVRRGYRVVIIEEGDTPGYQGSGNPRGMLMPRLSLQDSADAEFYNSAYFYSLHCLQLLDSQQQSWQQTGGMQLASSERIKKQLASYPEDSELVQVVDAESASQLCGLALSEKVQYFPGAACVYPQQILQKLIDAMGDALSIHYNVKVDSLNYSKHQWQLVNQQNQVVFIAEKLILASAWQTKRFKQCGHLHLQPARGQISFIKSSLQSRHLKLPVSYQGYILPENDGVHVAGASFEVDDCSCDLRDEEDQQNLSDLNQWFDGLFTKQDIIGGRASVRAVSSDRVPVVGQAVDSSQYIADYADLYKGRPAYKYPLASYHPHLYINTGHGARGFCSAFLCAEFLAATICNEPLPVSKRVRYALHPARFLIRSFKKRKVR